MKAESMLMTDDDVAAMLHISKRTLARRLAKPMEGEIDMNLAEPGIFGGKRFWLRERVERTVGIGK